MAEPSWKTSTLSQIAIASIGCYLLGALAILWLKQDIGPLRWAAEVFGVGYVAARTKPRDVPPPA